MLHRCTLQHTLWEYTRWFCAHFPSCQLTESQFSHLTKEYRHRKVKCFFGLSSKRSREEHDPARAPAAFTMLPHQPTFRLWFWQILELMRLDTSQGNRFIVWQGKISNICWLQGINHQFRLVSLTFSHIWCCSSSNKAFRNTQGWL